LWGGVLGFVGNAATTLEHEIANIPAGSIFSWKFAGSQNKNPLKDLLQLQKLKVFNFAVQASAPQLALKGLLLPQSSLTALS